MWHRYLSPTLVALVAVAAGCSAEQAAALRQVVAKRPPSREKRVELHSYAITVPRDEVALMLRAVNRLVDDGFGGQQIAEMIAELDDLSPGDVLTKRYKVAHGDRPAELEIQVFLDNPAEPALYFFAPRALRQSIGQYGEDLKQMLRDRDQFVDGAKQLVDASPGKGEE